MEGDMNKQTVEFCIFHSVQNQQNTHTSLQLQYCFSTHELLHISGLTGPSSGSAQFYNTIVGPYYHLQCVEGSEVH